MTTRHALERAGFMRRHDCRFLWRNRGYATFDDFLATFRADKRKKAKRERRKVVEAGIAFRTLRGEEIDRRALERDLRLFRAHVPAPRQRPLPERRFPGARVAAAHARSVMVKLAERDGRAARRRDLLRRRRLAVRPLLGHGAAHEDCLHFEACYYQGIEYCIERGLQFFDPGTQGEHKIARGFEPTRTTSAHWLEHAGFRTAVRRYLEREREAIDGYIASAQRAPAFPATADIGGMIPWLRPTIRPMRFRRVERALSEPDGLLCAGGDLTPARLLAAYRRGIFPWYSEGQPILWWSPDPRMVLFPRRIPGFAQPAPRRCATAASASRFDTCFRAKWSRDCADSGDACRRRHLDLTAKCTRLMSSCTGCGHAHSVEVWHDDQLVGGLYGIALGRVFFGESMFSTERDASKVALCHLVRGAAYPTST